MLSIVVGLLLMGSPEAMKLSEEGISLAKQGQYREAREALEQARKLEPNDGTLAFNLGQVCELMNDLPNAMKFYDEYLALTPAAPDVREVEARVARLKLAQMNVPEAAKEQLIQGQAYFRMLRMQEAEQAFKEAEKLAPEWPPVLYNLGSVYEGLNDYQTAALYFRRYLPFAQQNEVEGLRIKLAEFDIRMKDQEREAREAVERRELEAKAQQQKEREQAVAKAEAERKQKELEASQASSRAIGAVTCILLAVVGVVAVVYAIDQSAKTTEYSFARESMSQGRIRSRQATFSIGVTPLGSGGGMVGVSGRF